MAVETSRSRGIFRTGVLTTFNNVGSKFYNGDKFVSEEFSCDQDFRSPGFHLVLDFDADHLRPYEKGIRARLKNGGLSSKWVPYGKRDRRRVRIRWFKVAVFDTRRNLLCANETASSFDLCVRNDVEEEGEEEEWLCLDVVDPRENDPVPVLESPDPSRIWNLCGR